MSVPRSAGDPERTPPGPEDPPIDVPVLDLNPLLDRRRLLARGLALAVGALPAGSLLAACGDGMMGGSMSDDMMGEEMPDWMMSEGQTMGPGMMEDMRVIHQLLVSHDRIRRRVEDVADGIRAWTASGDSEVAGLIRTHVGQMKERVEDGEPIRLMDPLFREIFAHHTAIEMEVEETRAGVIVVETSADPQVELLIRQHAHRAVSEFVAEGMARAMEPTPLPRGYAES